MIADVAVVWPCPFEIDVCVRAGRQLRPPPQSCPTCNAVLTVQGGYNRLLRHRDRIERLWIWRGYCKRCDRSHALLPDFVVAFHRDTTDVIFAALDRRVVLDVPGSTRRGWQARFNRNTETVRSAIASAGVGFGAQVRDMRIDRLLMALWRAVRRASDMIASPWRILNIMSGGSWVRYRVNSSWRPFARFPRPP